MTPDTVAAVLTVVSGGLALWGLNQHLGRRVERHARIVAEAALRAHRERPEPVSTSVALTPKHRPYGPLESDPPGTATTGMLALSAPTPEPEQTEERLLGSWWPDPPPVDGWIDLTPEAFEPVPRALPTPTLINPVRSN